jgi:cytochrome c peroxidase
MRRCTLALTIFLVSACATDAPDPVSPSGSEAAFSRVSANRGALLAALGGRIFEDENLSLRRNQSCASCHDADWGFSAPDAGINAGGAVMQGSVHGRFGTRRPPSAAYATPSPVLYFDEVDGTYVGGNFWDGHATGARLGIPAAEQSQFPFVGAVEQALPDRACVIHRIATGRYADLWVRVYGSSIRSIHFPAGIDSMCAREDATIPLGSDARDRVNAEYDRMALAIAEFEDSPEVNRFDSKYDAYLEGRALLTPVELQGMALFNGKANCSA